MFKVEALYLTYGIIFGLGASLAYTPSLGILGLHFRKKMGLVNGLVTCGSSVFTIVLPPVLGKLLSTVGLDATLRVLALIVSFLIVAALLFKVTSCYPDVSRPSGRKYSLYFI